MQRCSAQGNKGGPAAAREEANGANERMGGRARLAASARVLRAGILCTKIVLNCVFCGVSHAGLSRTNHNNWSDNPLLLHDV